MPSIPTIVHSILLSVLVLLSYSTTCTHAFSGAFGFAASTKLARTSLQNSSVEESSSASATSWDMSLFSPAKINIFLRIIRKREDGFHDLASLFQTIGFGDYLHLKMLEDVDQDELTCNMEGVPTDGTNLVLRAIELLRQNTGITDKFFKVDLVKYVPHQAGLGGGSGNAAAALFGANELLGRPATVSIIYK